MLPQAYKFPLQAIAHIQSSSHLLSLSLNHNQRKKAKWDMRAYENTYNSISPHLKYHLVHCGGAIQFIDHHLDLFKQPCNLIGSFKIRVTISIVTIHAVFIFSLFQTGICVVFGRWRGDFPNKSFPFFPSATLQSSTVDITFKRWRLHDKWASPSSS